MSEHPFTRAAFVERLQQHSLAGTRCQACGALYLPPRPLCQQCYSPDMAWEEFPGWGELITFTVVHIAPSAMIEAGYGRDNPYVTGIVRLDEGPAISAHIIGVDPMQPDTIPLGGRVRLVHPERPDEKRPPILTFEIVPPPSPD